MELVCAVQQYAWGVHGMASSVAQLAKGGQPTLSVADDKPYAELWMGTHPSGPSFIKGTKETLADFIKGHPEVLGSTITKQFDQQLPFLFKVLSVNQALSIQAHPNKSHAEELHHERPDVYKDPNHKPEMTIALTPFQALCGFRPAEEIIKFLGEVPELRRVVGEENATNFCNKSCEQSLRACFASMMRASKETISAALVDAVTRFTQMGQSRQELFDLFLTLHSKYPGDVGCFSIFLLNYIVLQPGESMFLGPNIIHAYLLGDCIECMACSDNVVRAGLTPKYQDVDTLVSMLQYDMAPAESRKFKGSSKDACTTLYNPPVPDFAVEMIEVPESKNEYQIDAVDSASILLVVQGTAEGVGAPKSSGSSDSLALQRGTVVFIPAGQSLKLTKAGDALLAFRALCIN
ncbi:mannose phosphate isomerase [Oratosquilla oratoria]|uniref:mannose phosphate isomerase n=1 Tax=Oratosquilla oratoria TaxID=337810 RepID=UPI003F772A83